MIYGGHEGTIQIVTTCVFSFLAIVAVVLRIYVRCFVLHNFGLDGELIDPNVES